MNKMTDLESIVSDRENLLAEQVIIIKSNNERMCKLECIVEEHIESLVENIIAVEEQKELLDETIEKVIIEHEKLMQLKQLLVSKNNCLKKHMII